LKPIDEMRLIWFTYKTTNQLHLSLHSLYYVEAC